MTRPILGWDVGGANIKAARVLGTEPGPSVVECPHPIWRAPHGLADALGRVADALGRPSRMAVTMTAELADCFATKSEGVGFVLDAFRTAFPDVDPWIYGVDGRFHRPDAAREAPHNVAAANWMASAALVARTWPDALLIDVGSTTTDIVPIVGGGVAAVGATDPSRLQSGELVYTGLLRTPVCAIVRSVPLRGRRCPVAAEHFAIAADAHVWLGRIDERDYGCDTPDGRGTGRREAGARLARVVCADLDMLTPADITAVAEHVARAQVRQIAIAVRRVMRRLGPACPRVAVLAGQGALVGREAAGAAGLPARDLAELFGPAAARAAPAVAVARLLDLMLAPSGGGRP